MVGIWQLLLLVLLLGQASAQAQERTWGKLAAGEFRAPTVTGGERYNPWSRLGQGDDQDAAEHTPRFVERPKQQYQVPERPRYPQAELYRGTVQDGQWHETPMFGWTAPTFPGGYGWPLTGPNHYSYPYYGGLYPGLGYSGLGGYPGLGTGSFPGSSWVPWGLFPW